MGWNPSTWAGAQKHRREIINMGRNDHDMGGSVETWARQKKHGPGLDKTGGFL
ncbi:hypothetical protein [Lentibacillus amyloliquefaciens]|uniref:hypothetical protein n=1 Tax=Lentibacillus amyloliquefaciens TaxID=1472767 RepID=UPI0012E37A21|nr:hypothetical protein [Lentibacillus amyloliquefaciens]